MRQGQRRARDRGAAGVATTLPRPFGARHAAVEDSAASGVEGNARLTGLNGVLLVVLLAVEGATILRIRQLISVHVYVGVLLVGPVLLKCASTSTGSSGTTPVREPTGRRGRPADAAGTRSPRHPDHVRSVRHRRRPARGAARPCRLLLTAHKASFVVWFAVMTVHVRGHIRAAAVDTWRDLRGSPSDPAGR